MERILLDLGSRSYNISIGAGLLSDPAQFERLVRASKVVVVTNETIGPLYLDKLYSSLALLQITPYSFVLPDGERYKTLEQFDRILTYLLHINASRDTVLIALGGGVVGDLVGFSAACYQRGIDFIQIPTSLLAQVDSSVGGKTAINHSLGKNMIGAFHQPQSVIIDINCLKTLANKEFAAGMAEVIKYGIIYDNKFFDWVEQSIDPLYALNEDALTYAISRCCQIKANIVALDETEQGLRALLNLGHTFGHAIEAHLGYGHWLHGEAVSVGMVLAAKTAQLQSMLTEADLMRIVQLLRAAKLPVTAPAQMSFDDYMTVMMRDKKVIAGELRLVLPTQIGQAEVVKNTPIESIRASIEWCKKL